jgi:hypothetical protein
MQKVILKKLVEKLKDTEWFIISGFAVEVYTNGRRKAKDIDFVLRDRDIDLFARRLGTKAQRRKIDKGTFEVDDYGFETNFEGQMLEATNGYPRIRMSDTKKFNKLFGVRVKKKYLGVELFLAPIEEIIVGKAVMHRSKDIHDLKLLRNEKIDFGFLIELAKDWGKKSTVIKTLRNLGYDV